MLLSFAANTVQDSRGGPAVSNRDKLKVLIEY